MKKIIGAFIAGIALCATPILASAGGYGNYGGYGMQDSYGYQYQQPSYVYTSGYPSSGQRYGNQYWCSGMYGSYTSYTPCSYGYNYGYGNGYQDYGYSYSYTYPQYSYTYPMYYAYTMPSYTYSYLYY